MYAHSHGATSCYMKRDTKGTDEAWETDIPSAWCFYMTSFTDSTAFLRRIWSKHTLSDAERAGLTGPHKTQLSFEQITDSPLLSDRAHDWLIDWLIRVSRRLMPVVGKRRLSSYCTYSLATKREKELDRDECLEVSGTLGLSRSYCIYVPGWREERLSLCCSAREYIVESR